MMLISVCALGMLGVALRFGADQFMSGSAFPWSTFIVNIIGCFLAGWLLSQPNINPMLKTSAIIGFCGGLTTFSALILQTSTMIGQGEFLKGFIYFMMTQVFGFLALWLGVKLR
jgi:CrcB protein